MGQIENLLNMMSGDWDFAHGILLLGGALTSLLTIYTNTVKKLNENMTGLMSQAEIEFAEWNKSGELKHKWVRDQLNKMLPALLRPLFPKSKLNGMVSSAFNEIEKFSELRGNEVRGAYEADAPEQVFNGDEEDAVHIDNGQIDGIQVNDITVSGQKGYVNVRIDFFIPPNDAA